MNKYEKKILGRQKLAQYLNTLKPQSDWDNYKIGIGKESHNAKRICHRKEAMMNDWWRGISSVTLVLWP